ncbi:putative telomere-associated protein RIF1-like isoform X2 [Sesbania bispinosa]|nr:putative telomere-associated protein RIF1-like isoform X2 [Sesbania bispinosa]
MAMLSCGNPNVVFINGFNTNLDTHLALIVSNHNTVLDHKSNRVSVDKMSNCFLMVLLKKHSKRKIHDS